LKNKTPKISIGIIDKSVSLMALLKVDYYASEKKTQKQTNPVSILYNPGHKMSVDVGHRPVYDLFHEQRHLLLNALHSQRPRKSEEGNDAAPFNTVTKQFIHDRHKRCLGIVRSDVQLVTHIVKHLHQMCTKHLQ